MKFREHQFANRRPKAWTVLNPEVPQEPTLNEQIGLSPLLEARLRSQREFGVRPIDKYSSQMETLVHLITLFPNEAEKFRALTPVTKVVPILEKEIQAKSPCVIDLSTLTTLFYLSLLVPKEVPTLPPHALTQWLTPVRTGIVSQRGMMWAARAIRLDPSCGEEIKKKVSTNLEQTVNEKPVSEENLYAIQYALQVDPTLHKKFHLYAKNHVEELKAFFMHERTHGKYRSTGELSSLFATYKLLLADEIEVSPTGILLAVERPRVGKVTPLPERSLTP